LTMVQGDDPGKGPGKKEQLPAPDYHAAKVGGALSLREDRRFLQVKGRAPGEMLDGLLSNSPPPAPQGRGSVLRGRTVYSTLLTHKGKMISDLRVMSEKGGFLLDLPERGLQGSLEHLHKFLPPRMAWVQDRSREYGMLTVVGPEIPTLLSESWVRLGVRDPAQEMGAMEEGDEFIWEVADEETVRLLRNEDLDAEAWDVLASLASIRRLRTELEGEGVVPLSEEAREVLRVERGRPAFGVDMDEDTIPLEAGIGERAIDVGKGCYTGQEVIIRIRDRGHVNRELRGLVFEGEEAPDAGSPLFRPDDVKPAGHITSTVWSPAYRSVLGLGYLRRGLAEGDVVASGRPDGPRARVKGLGRKGWAAA